MDALSASYDYAARLTRAAAKNFYYAFFGLPRARRRSLYAVYAWSRRVDDAVDAVEDRGIDRSQALADLEHLRGLLHGGDRADPLGPAIVDTIARYSIPRAHFEALIAGMLMDLDERRYATFADLYVYCYRAAAVVGLICLEIFGYTDARAHAPAEALGIAMQLTNILRDVDEDLRRGRIYLPLEDLARFGLSAADLERREADARFRDLMRFEAARARDYFAQAEALFPLVDPVSRYCPLLLRSLYMRLLKRIERGGYDVFRGRQRLPVHEKLGLAAKAWVRSRFWRAGAPRPGA